MTPSTGTTRHISQSPVRWVHTHLCEEADDDIVLPTLENVMQLIIFGVFQPQLLESRD